jgi:3-oxoadipate enol-lactonase
MAYVNLNSVRIHYELSGKANLPVLVLSHSVGVNLATWEPQLQALAPHFQILRYDMRGHGASSTPPGPYTVADLGADVLGLLDALDLPQASFCGLSIGGLIGQWLGLNAPHRLHKLVLASAAAKIGTEETWNTRIATVLREGLDPIIPGTLERWFTGGFRAAQPQTIDQTAAMLHATSVAGYTASCAAVRDADFRSSIQQIGVPVLVITGKADPVTTVSDGKFLAGAISGAAYTELPAAHLSNVEAAGTFNTALRAFLADTAFSELL